METPPWMKVMMDADREDGFDEKFGTDTWSEAERLDPLPAFNHFPTMPRWFHGIMSKIEVAHEELTFLDVGCGKGRVLLMATDYPFKKCIGYERGKSLIETAKANVAKYQSPAQRCKDIEVVAGDVLESTWPAQGDLFVYLFNPWKDVEVCEAFRDHMQRAHEASPRKIVFLYTRPVHAKVFDESTFLHRWGPQGLEALPPEVNVEHFLAGRYSWALFSNF